MANLIWHIKNFFSLFWNVHLMHRCPVCGKRLIETDYPHDFVQRAKCSDRKCGWGWAK